MPAAGADEGRFVCKHCGSTRSIVRYTFREADKRILECTGCRLMVLDPLPTLQDLQQVYNEGYFDNQDLIRNDDVSRVYGYVDYISERINKQRGYQGICARLRRVVISPRTRPTLLDYGCGLGFFLDTAYEHGFDVHGVEFNQHALQYIRNRYTYRASHAAALDRRERYDVITLFDVIEHLREPFEALSMFREMLHDNGILVMSTMNATSLTSRLMGKRLEDFRRISEHLFFFSTANLVAILRKHGFEIVKLASLGHSFEVRLLASRARATFPILGVPMTWFVKLFPFVGNWSFYVNPRTKFIVYARKRQSTVRDATTGKRLSVILPADDTTAALQPMLDRLLRLDAGGTTIEIIVVDDGAGGGRAAILGSYSDRPEIAVVSGPRGGKGAALAAGIAASRGDYVIVQDADGEYDPADIPGMIRTMAETGALAVFGSRYSGRFRRSGRFAATLGNRFLTLMSNAVNDLNLSDVMTGYKLLNGVLARSLTIRSRGHEVEAELTCRIRRLGLDIYEAPITYNPRSSFERRKIGVRDAWRTCVAIVRYGVFGGE
jgi:hypothetical protein